MAQASSEPFRQMARLFLALCPPAQVRAALAQHVMQWRWNPNARPYAPADWHITLHFLGEVSQDRVTALGRDLTVQFEPFTLSFGRAALWPHGLAVLLPSAPSPALERLQISLGAALQGLGMPVDGRPYCPHVTLARHAAGAVQPAQEAGFQWPVEGYELMESTGRTDQRYRTLQSYRAVD